MKRLPPVLRCQVDESLGDQCGPIEKGNRVYIGSELPSCGLKEEYLLDYQAREREEWLQYLRNNDPLSPDHAPFLARVLVPGSMTLEFIPKPK